MCAFWNGITWACAIGMVLEQVWWMPMAIPHIVLGLWLVHAVVCSFTNRLRITITEAHITRVDEPVPPHAAWSIGLALAASLRVVDRWYDNDGTCVEWTLSITGRDGSTHRVFRAHGSHTGEPNDELEPIALALAEALALPVERERRDERPSALR